MPKNLRSLGLRAKWQLAVTAKVALELAGHRTFLFLLLFFVVFFLFLCVVVRAVSEAGCLETKVLWSQFAKAWTWVKGARVNLRTDTRTGFAFWNFGSFPPPTFQNSTSCAVDIEPMHNSFMSLVLIYVYARFNSWGPSTTHLLSRHPLSPRLQISPNRFGILSLIQMKVKNRISR